MTGWSDRACWPFPSHLSGGNWKVANLVGQSSEEWELAWEEIGMHSTMPQILCSNSWKGNIPLPPPWPHTCVFVPQVRVMQRLEHHRWEHSVPSEEPDWPPQRLAPGHWDWDLGAQAHALFTEESPTSWQLAYRQMSRHFCGIIPWDTHVPELSPSLLVYLVINIIVNIAINST